MKYRQLLAPTFLRETIFFHYIFWHSKYVIKVNYKRNSVMHLLERLQRQRWRIRFQRQGSGLFVFLYSIIWAIKVSFLLVIVLPSLFIRVGNRISCRNLRRKVLPQDFFRFLTTIRRIVRIYEVVDRFLRKPLWFPSSNFSIFGRIQMRFWDYNLGSYNVRIKLLSFLVIKRSLFLLARGRCRLLFISFKTFKTL